MGKRVGVSFSRPGGNPSTAQVPFRHSGTVLTGIRKTAGVDSG